jgi:hypothetical protein
MLTSMRTNTWLFTGITDQNTGLKGVKRKMSDEQDADLLYYRSAFRSSLLWALILVCVIGLIIVLC